MVRLVKLLLIREIGGALQSGSIVNIKGGGICELKGAPSAFDKDWVVMLRKE
jgi:hypothetical protein